MPEYYRHLLLIVKYLFYVGFKVLTLKLTGSFASNAKFSTSFVMENFSIDCIINSCL